jgi:hypothetical protein
MEFKRYAIEDARNEHEKAYGPLYTLLSKHVSGSCEKKGFGLSLRTEGDWMT